MNVSPLYPEPNSSQAPVCVDTEEEGGDNKCYERWIIPKCTTNITNVN
jgi:hypothetical protein